MKMRSVFCFIWGFMALSLFTLQSHGEEAKGFIETLGREAIETLTNPNAPEGEIESKFAQLLDRDFAVSEIASFVLGKYNRGASPETKQKFQSIFRERLKKSYAARFKQYRGVKFNVKSAAPAGADYSVVKSTIQEAKANAPLVNVDWKVRGKKIFDVIIGDVSMATTLRSEYASAITEKGGLEQFIQSKS